MRTFEDHQTQGLYGVGDTRRSNVRCAGCGKGEYLTRHGAKITTDSYGRRQQFCWCDHQECGSTVFLVLPLPEQPNKDPWKEVAVFEKDELDNRIASLTGFFASETYCNLPDQDRALMITQYVEMMDYSNTLLQRICRFAAIGPGDKVNS